MNIRLMRNGEWFETIEVERMPKIGDLVVGNLDRAYRVQAVDELSEPNRWPLVEAKYEPSVWDEEDPLNAVPDRAMHNAFK